ncbi:hypothetical protein NL108_004052 [Boleophthalmus pectinirostris]|nr:hypothetical protein NL108_004052 [Boleophthalmus pectinirostris]
MTTAEHLLQYILPVLVVSIAVVLMCYYHYSKKRRGSYDVTTPPLRVHTAVQPEDGAEMVVFITNVPPGYSTTDPPPPYSPFDPKLSFVWSGGEPPPYEMYP